MSGRAIRLQEKEKRRQLFAQQPTPAEKPRTLRQLMEWHALGKRIEITPEELEKLPPGNEDPVTVGEDSDFELALDDDAALVDETGVEVVTLSEEELLAEEEMQALLRRVRPGRTQYPEEEWEVAVVEPYEEDKPPRTPWYAPVLEWCEEHEVALLAMATGVLAAITAVAWLAIVLLQAVIHQNFVVEQSAGWWTEVLVLARDPGLTITASLFVIALASIIITIMMFDSNIDRLQMCTTMPIVVAAMVGALWLARWLFLWVVSFF